jgi:RNA ligase (TIGR02306 family)
MSTHEVRVYKVDKVHKHPNADKIGLVYIEGFTAIVRLGDIVEGDLVAYIEPDYVVPDTQQFSFLDGKFRIKSKRLRGLWSQGLLIKAPPGSKEGECVMSKLGITRYEPPARVFAGRGGPGGTLGSSDEEKPHESLKGISVYDLENWRKHRKVLEEGEDVIITEKIHGCNAKYAYRNGRMYVGSRTRWVKNGDPTKFDLLMDRVRMFFLAWFPSLRKVWRRRFSMHGQNVWWKVLKENKWIEDFCKENQDCVLYGEVFGSVQDLKYGAEDGQVFFRAFDVLKGDKFLDSLDFNYVFDDNQVAPVLYRGPYSAKAVEELSLLDKSKLASHLAEGVVIKPLRERFDPRVGRVALKLVSDKYLSRND